MKKSWVMLLVITVSAMYLQACAPKAEKDCGFVQNSYGERVSWNSSLPVRMYLHQSVPQEYVPAIISAANSWNIALGKEAIIIDTSRRVQGANQPSQDGANIIYFLNDWESDKYDEQARTSIYWVGDQLKEADIRINDKVYDFYFSQTGPIATASTAINIEALVLHEMGHVLGLKHEDEHNSVMATYLPARTDRVQVAEADLNSLKCEY